MATLIPDFLFEGDDLVELYRLHPDPHFPPGGMAAGARQLPFFTGRIRLSSWIGLSLPLPSIPVWFIGSPITDLFPPVTSEGTDADDIIRGMEGEADRAGAWVIIVKDLPAGHVLERSLAQAGFISVAHDPVWYCAVPDSLSAFFQGLSRGRRRGLEGRLRKFDREVSIRDAREDDADFMKRSYDRLWLRSGMRLERLSRSFFLGAVRHPSCRLLLFENLGTPFGFQMLWRQGTRWFDKYIGADDRLSREYSFYSMSMLHALRIARSHGIEWYIAGQGSGADKAAFGFRRVAVNLWIKPLVFRLISPRLVARFSRMHRERVYSPEGGVD